MHNTQSTQLLFELSKPGCCAVRLPACDVPGKPLLYATTQKFLTLFGLKGLKDLPTLEDIKQLDEHTLPLFTLKPEEGDSLPAEEAPGFEEGHVPEEAQVPEEDMAGPVGQNPRQRLGALLIR